jgi:exopolysaccharide biosynthesis polyprenyl glycosylphosphotransferase
MSARAGEVGASGIAERGPSRALPFRLERRAAQFVASAGRVAAVWLPVFALAALDESSTRDAVVFSSLVTIGWMLGLRRALFTAQSTMSPLGVWVAAALGASVGFVLVSALTAWLPWIDFSTGDLLKMAGAVFICSSLWETLVDSSVAAEQRVLIVGADPGGDLAEELLNHQRSSFSVVGFVVDDEDVAPGELARLPEVVRVHKPDLVVMVSQRPETLNALLDVANAGFRVVGLPTFHEHAFGRVPVRFVNPTWFMSVLHLYRQPYPRFAKRAFDIVVASSGLLLTAPLLPLIALAVSRTPGPIIYRQVRIGEGGAPFEMLKFRTMLADAERDGAKFAAQEDARVTRLGRFLRRTRLDELPQLWNVLRGEMSVVGPRPERPQFMGELQDAVPFFSRRLLVKPGITGWAQLHSGYAADADAMAEKLSYDLWYLRHRSLVLDLVICVKTLSTLLSGSGAR